MSYELAWEPKGFYRRYYGCTTDLEVAETTFMFEASPEFEDMRYTILDFLDATDLTVVNSSYIEEAAAIDRIASRLNTRVKIAVVTTSELVIKLAKEYLDHPLRVYPIEIFQTLEDARKWVDDEVPLSPLTAKIGMRC